MLTPPKALSKLTLILLVTWSHARSQNIAGIYASPNDFAIHKLSFKNYSKKYKVKLHEHPYRKQITIIHNDSSYKLVKDSIYGYEDRSGVCFRFAGKHIYTILNPNDSIILYQLNIPGKGKDMNMYPSYHFSRGYAGKIFPLTIDNIINEFKNNQKFTDGIETHFKTNSDLLKFDNIHNDYKVNYLLKTCN